MLVVDEQEGMRVLPTFIKVSVIIPLYNVADFIAATIEQLQQQTLQDVEFILIDDGSTDGTYDIAEAYAQRDARIHLVRQPNRGPSNARNHGLRLVRGDYICFVDSDDILSQDALELMYNAAMEHDADLVMGGTVRFNSERTWYIKTYVEHGILEPGPKHISTHPGLLYAVGPCAKLYKKNLIDGVFFPEQIRLGEDQPFAIQAYIRAKKIFTVDAIVYFYRLREGESKSLTQQAVHRPLEIFNDLYEMLDIAAGILKGHHELYLKYLERVISCDIWPRVKAAIRSDQGDVQAAAIHSLATWIQSLDSRLFSNVQGLYYYPLVGIVYRLPYLKPPAHRAFIRLLFIILMKLRPSAYFRLLSTVTTKLARRGWSKLRKQIRKGMSSLQAFIQLRIVFGLAKKLPVQRKVVLASNKGAEFTGNLKVVDAALKKSHPKWRVKNYPRCKRGFIDRCKQFYHMGRAKVIFLDDYYYQLYGLTGRHDGDIVQLWHAAGAFKKFGLSSEGAGDANPLSFELAAHQSYTKVISSSSSIRPLYAEAFNVPEADVLPLGVPRTDVFFDKDEMARIRTRYLTAYPQLAGKKMILYAPTFRGTPRQRVRFQLALDLEQLAAALSDEYVVVLKLHPSVREGVKIPDHLAHFAVDLSSEADINELLMIADLLITDYSSVVFEYSLLQRPMVFFAYDLESYLDERGFYFNYEAFVPGPIAATTEEVIQVIQAGMFDLERIDAFAKYFFDDRDGCATERLLERFLK